MRLKMEAFKDEKEKEIAMKKKKTEKKTKKKTSRNRFVDAHSYMDEMKEMFEKVKKKKKKKKKTKTQPIDFQRVSLVLTQKEEAPSKLSKQVRKEVKRARKIRKQLPSHPTIFPSQIGADVEAQLAEIAEQNKRREEEKEYNRRYWGRCVRKRNNSRW
jgi:hypothetical protein